MNSSKRNYYTVAEAAEVLEVHPETVRRWIRSNSIEHMRFGPRGYSRIPKDVCDQRIRERDVDLAEQTAS